MNWRAGIDSARDVRRALMACAVLGWLAVAVHCLFKWMVERS